LGTSLLSLTGYDDRLRMHCLLAYVNCKPTKTGVSFTWEGAWEYDPMSGSGHATGRAQPQCPPSRPRVPEPLPDQLPFVLGERGQHVLNKVGHGQPGPVERLPCECDLHP